MDVGYRLDHPFFITKCFIHRLRYCVYACNAICCSYTFVDIKPLHYCSSFQYPVPSKIFCCSIIYLGSYKLCIPKPVPGRNNKHQESVI